MFAAFLFSGVAILLTLVLIPLGLLLMAFWIWMLVDAIQKKVWASQTRNFLRG
jgi:hypothetical protein